MRKQQLDDDLPIQHDQHGLVHAAGCHHARWSLQVEPQALCMLHSVLLLLSQRGTYHHDRRNEIQLLRFSRSHQLGRYYTSRYRRRLHCVD